jgi:hypothetical protein
MNQPDSAKSPEEVTAKARGNHSGKSSGRLRLALLGMLYIIWLGWLFYVGSF